MKKRFMKFAAICAATMLILPLVAEAKHKCPPPPQPAVISESVVLTETAYYPNGLIIGEGVSISANDGYSVTMTVNGVETGQKLETTAGVNTVFVPGTYMGKVVLTVNETNVVTDEGYNFPFRQALCVDADGVVDAKSVFPAINGGKVTDNYAKGIRISSTGECFGGAFVGGGATYKIEKSKINLIGDSRSDFVGYGVGLVGTGEGTTLVADGVDIYAKGVVRAAVVADHTANVIVKNSRIQTKNGILPDDYVGTIDTSQMRSVPWMLGLSGNNRATNILGDYTQASYINSYIGAEGWGVLSTDGCTSPVLTAINSTIAITGEDGYGSYGIGNATEYFLGCNMNVATYATISRGSYLYYGDSNPAVVADLNENLGLGLTAKELKSLRKRPTIVKSDRFGIMWHGGGTLDVSGGTVFCTKESTFLDKGQAITITVDGSKGAKLLPKNGVIMQLMDDDDCGPNMQAGGATTNSYTEPTDAVTIDSTHDTAIADSTDAIATFSNIKLKGNFYNSTRGGIVQGPFGPPSSASKNLGLTFNNSIVSGIITSSTAVHDQSTITSDEYYLLGKVTNTPAAAINNGVVVSLANNSKWVVAGTSYLTSLTIGEGSSVVAPKFKTLTMTVDGVETAIVAGNTYTGAIELSID